MMYTGFVLKYKNKDYITYCFINTYGWACVSAATWITRMGHLDMRLPVGESSKFKVAIMDLLHCSPG